MLTNTFSFENGYLVQIDDLLAKKPTPVPPVPPGPIPTVDPIEQVSVQLALEGASLNISATGDLSTLDHYEIVAYSVNGQPVKTVNNGKLTEYELTSLDKEIPEGDYTIECTAVSVYGNASKKSNAIEYTVLPAPEAMTLRFEFSKNDYDPVAAGVGSSGTWKKLNTKDQNVWDWTKSGTSFLSAFTNAFTDSDNLVSVIEVGDTSSVTDMGAMFQGCTSLTSIPLFDTSSVTKMGAMFQGCTSLTSIPLFDTSSVTQMGSMFRDCTSLTSIPLFDTSSVTNMSLMFRGCTLTSVPLFDTSKVTNMNSIFLECTSLTSVPLFDMSSVTTINGGFKNCASLTGIPLFNTSSVTDMGSLFRGCSSLTSIPLFDTSKVTNMTYAFDGCTNVEEGALALYQKVSTQAAPPSSHYNTFNDCGKNTETGATELAQIPRSWGGLAEG